MSTPPEAQGMIWPSRREFWRGHVVRGGVILLASTGLVAITNLLYNILIARMLGASGFGHASALYTLLMLIAAVSLSFQIVTSKFIARTPEEGLRPPIYASLLRRSWQVGLGVAALLGACSTYLKSYLNLPAQHDLFLLAVAVGVYIPLGVRRGRMQGCYDFRGLAINVVVEVLVKLCGALFFLRLGMGVTGVMLGILLSIVAAYAASAPGPEYRVTPGPLRIAPAAEGRQAVLYFVGQVILGNLDILLVKHFFPPAEAGIYAAVALVGRVVFMLSWSIVSSMFPVSASNTQRHSGRSVLWTALLLVGAVLSLSIGAVALAPESAWTALLGAQFLIAKIASLSSLLTQYALMTGIYCLASVVMMYEVSRRIGSAAWLQLGISGLLAGGIWIYHGSLSQVILVQMVLMSGLLVLVTVPLFREPEEAMPNLAMAEPLRRLRRAPEDEVVAEFLRGEFYHPYYDNYRGSFAHLVEHANLDNAHENFIRRALLFGRRGRLWRELPHDTEWWAVELTAPDLARLQSFPRNEWRRFAGSGFCLTEMVSRIQAGLARGQQSHTLRKLREIADDLRGDEVPDAVLLIGIDEYQPLTILEGNHRMIAAMLTMPESAHRRFRFYCGLSPDMGACCWHRTGLRSVTRYVRHSVSYMFGEADVFVARTLRDRLTDTRHW